MARPNNQYRQSGMHRVGSRKVNGRCAEWQKTKEPIKRKQKIREWRIPSIGQLSFIGLYSWHFRESKVSGDSGEYAYLYLSSRFKLIGLGDDRWLALSAGRDV